MSSLPVPSSPRKNTDLATTTDAPAASPSVRARSRNPSPRSSHGPRAPKPGSERRQRLDDIRAQRRFILKQLRSLHEQALHLWIDTDSDGSLSDAADSTTLSLVGNAANWAASAYEDAAPKDRRQEALFITVVAKANEILLRLRDRVRAGQDCLVSVTIHRAADMTGTDAFLVELKPAGARQPLAGEVVS